MRASLDRGWCLSRHHHPDQLLILAAIGRVDPDQLPVDHPLHNVWSLDIGIEVLDDPELPQPEHRHVRALLTIAPRIAGHPDGLHFARLTEELDRRGLSWPLLGIWPHGIIDSLTDLYAARVTSRPLDPYMHTYQQPIPALAARWWDAAHRWATVITGLADYDPRYSVGDYLDAERDLADLGVTIAAATGDSHRIADATPIQRDAHQRHDLHRHLARSDTNR